ncbi:MAG: methyltransferase domain-containing protein [Clostridia bacterium]|nr:methyltransferase domain-containing protein [Clostridia bacterium]
MAEKISTKINENITLLQRSDGLVFGTDAYLLSCFVSGVRGGYAAELGSGTGVISLLLASRGRFEHIIGVDIQEEFCALGNENAKANALSDKTEFICRDIKTLGRGDLGREFDCVFCNPPYIESGSGKQNDSAKKAVARHDTFGGIFEFAACAARLLKFGKKFYCVYRPERLCDLIDAMRQNNIEPKEIVFLHPDSDSAPSLVLALGTLGGKKGVIVRKPLVIYKDFEHKEYTDEMKQIYDKGEIRYDRTGKLLF